MEHRQHKCWESTAPFQVYFDPQGREQEGVSNNSKYYLHIQILWAIWTCFKRVQVALTCVRSCLYGSCSHIPRAIQGIQLTSLVLGAKFLHRNNSLLQYFSLFFLKILNFFLSDSFFSWEYGAKKLHQTKNQLDS